MRNCHGLFVNVCLVLVGLTCLCGCMGTIQPESITPLELNVLNRHTGSVKIQTSVLENNVKGEQTILAPETLEKSIAQAIAETKLFSAVEQGNADYLLDVKVTGINGHAGFTCDFTIRSIWRLTLLSDNKVVYTDFVGAEGEATLSDATNGYKRIRIALEHTTKKLVKTGIENLGKAELQ